MPNAATSAASVPATSASTTPPKNHPTNFSHPAPPQAKVGQKRTRTNFNDDDDNEDISNRHELHLPLGANLNVDSELPHDETPPLPLDDDLDMEDFLPSSEQDNGGNWLLDDINVAALNATTQYLQLHEPASDSTPFQKPQSDDFNLQHDPFNPSVLDTPASETLPIVTPEAETRTQTPSAACEVQSNTPSANLGNQQWHQQQHPDALHNFHPEQLPEIKTHIILTQEQVQPRSGSSSAVRIAPRSNTAQSPSPESSPQARSAPTRKRSRNTSAFVSSPAQIAPTPTNTTNIPVSQPIQPASVQTTTPAPPPHPMVAPMLFAQGIQHASPKNNNPQSSQDQSNKLSPFVPLQIAPSAQQSTPAAQPIAPPPALSTTPGMMPVDPNVLMQMAQQMWYAAMAASGNTPLPQGLPGPNQPPVFNAPRQFIPQQQNQPNPIPQQQQQRNPTTPTANLSNNVQHNSEPNKSHPVFISDNGKHVVVEQQAPAKLMRHPVLGRLQLQSKHQAALEQSPNPAPAPQEHEAKTENESSPSTAPMQNSSAKDRRKRLVWTPELHDRFVQAISAVGIHQAVPKTLVQIMNVEGLTTEHVKSHLQKYRNSLRKAATEDEKDKRKDRNTLILRPAADNTPRTPREVRIVPNRAIGPPTRHIPQPPAQKTLQAGRDINSLTPQLSRPPEPSELPEPSVSLERQSVVPAEKKRPPAAPMLAENPSEQPQAPALKHEANQDDDIPVLSGTTEQMHERTMQLQYQLQVLVHRTVALQKQLQVKIGKQSKEDGSSTVQAESKPHDKDEERQKMQLEYLDSLRQSQKVRRELGIIQQKLGAEQP